MIKIKTDIDRTCCFSLEAENGSSLVNSVEFANEAEMNTAIQILKTKPLTRNHFERKTNTDGRFLFLIKNDGGVTIARSEPYDSEAGMENGIKNLQENIDILL